MRRLMSLQVYMSLLLQMFVDGSETHFRVVNGVPETARVFAITIGHNGIIHLTIEDESFAPVPEGDPIPVFPAPIFKTVTARMEGRAT